MGGGGGGMSHALGVKAYLSVPWCQITEDEYSCDIEESTEKVKASPPPASDFQALVQDVSYVHSELKRLRGKYNNR